MLCDDPRDAPQSKNSSIEWIYFINYHARRIGDCMSLGFAFGTSKSVVGANRYEMKWPTRLWVVYLEIAVMVLILFSRACIPA